MQIQSDEAALTTEAVSRVLKPATIIKNVFVFDSIGSTNVYSKTLVTNGISDPTLVVAEEQTHGHGRFGRAWHSEKGKNLTFSLIVKPQVPTDRIGALPLCVAESVASAVESRVPVPVETRWPNDLFISGKKISGILMESVIMGRRFAAIIVGIGLNVNQKTFPQDLNATSLSLLLGKTLDRLRLLSEIVKRLAWLDGQISVSEVGEKLEKWKRRCETFGKMIRVQAGEKTFSGIAKDIATDGGLLVDVNGLEQEVRAGDLTIRES